MKRGYIAGGALLAWASAGLPHSIANELDCVIEPKSTINLGSYEEGVLSELYVDRGSRVKKGQLLAELDIDIERHAAELARLQAESDVEMRSGRVQQDFRGMELDRVSELEARRVVPRRDYDQAVVEQQLAELALEGAETSQRLAQVEYELAKARLERRSIRSPVDGVVAEVIMARGEYVHKQTSLMTIAEIDPLYVEVFSPVTEFGKIQEGMIAEVLPEEPVGGSYRAEVVVVDRVFDPASRSFGIRLELPNPDYALPAGLRCRVVFDIEAE